MTWTLAIDTSTEAKVGLAHGDEIVAVGGVGDRMQHVEQLVPLVRHVCEVGSVEAADLDLVVVGLGPGPFTGLRVGVATARILALVERARLHGVTGLDVLARQAVETGTVTAEFVAAVDARRKEVYWARYAADGTRLAGPSVDRPVDLPALPVIGPALTAYPDLPTITGAPTTLDVGLMARLGEGLPSAGDEPLYLRRPDATLPGTVKSVLPTSERVAR